MKQTNMKQIMWLICIVVLLPGCLWFETPKGKTSSSTSSSEGNLVVEGTVYVINCVYQQKDGKLVYALTLIFPHKQHYYPAVRYVDGELKETGEIYAQGEAGEGHTRKAIYYDDARPRFGETKIADVPFHYVYFIDDGKIVFQKSNEDLGIDYSNPKEERNWYPTLEKLIRENVTPQQEQ